MSKACAGGGGGGEGQGRGQGGLSRFVIGYKDDEQHVGPMDGSMKNEVFRGEMEEDDDDDDSVRKRWRALSPTTGLGVNGQRY